MMRSHILVTILAMALMSVATFAQEPGRVSLGNLGRTTEGLILPAPADDLLVQLEQAERRRRTALRWAKTTRWAALAAFTFGTVGEMTRPTYDQATGMGTLASLTVMGIGIWGHFEAKKMDRKIADIKTRQAAYVVPLQGGLSAGYQVGW